MARKQKQGSKVRLVVSDEKDVRMKVRPGEKLDVVQVEAIMPDLRRASRVGARLCGYGSGTCLAIVEIDK